MLMFDASIVTLSCIFLEVLFTVPVTAIERVLAPVEVTV